MTHLAPQLAAVRGGASAEIRSLAPPLERVLGRIRLRAQRRVAWLRKLWSEEEPPGGTFAVAHGEVDTHLLDRDSPAAEAAWIASDPFANGLTREVAALEGVMEGDRDSRLAQLERIFGLDNEECDIFQGCLAVSLDPSLARVYAYLQDCAGRGYATEELMGRLFDHGRRTVLRSASPLSVWRLVTVRDAAPGEPRMLECDPAVRDWLCGRDELDAQIQAAARIVRPQPPLENWPVEETADHIASLIGQDVPTRTCIVGPVGSGCRTLAATIAEKLQRTLLAVDSDAVADLDWPEVFVRATRHALLSNCALAWHGDGACERPWPSTPPPRAPLQFVICAPLQNPLPLKDVAEHCIEMPPLSQEERRRLWHHHLPVSQAWEKADAEALFGRSSVTVEKIVEVSRSAVQTADAAAERLQETARRGLGDLVEVVNCPFDWDDLVVPEHVRQALEDFVFEGQARVDFWEDARHRRLFPQGRGLFALLAGAPGVGKTMIAQVVARALSRDLYRIDVSRVVSKYVGDTSKNLRRLLSSVPTDEVLLFDEADALFGKRPSETGDAHDRYAVQESSTLLMAIEGAMEGRGASGVGSGPIGLLATNRKNAIDSAFIRRLRYVIDVPKPDASGRLQLWQQLVDDLAGASALSAVSGGLELLSREVETTGAQIKSATLSALFAARKDGERLSVRHLLHGLERELRKDGRGWSARERERLMRHGR